MRLLGATGNHFTQQIRCFLLYDIGFAYLDRQICFGIVLKCVWGGGVWKVGQKNKGIQKILIPLTLTNKQHIK